MRRSRGEAFQASWKGEYQPEGRMSLVCKGQCGWDIVGKEERRGNRAREREPKPGILF